MVTNDFFGKLYWQEIVLNFFFLQKERGLGKTMFLEMVYKEIQVQ